MKQQNEAGVSEGMSAEPDAAYLIRAIAHFKDTRGKHDGAHELSLKVCAKCEAAYIRAEEALDAILIEWATADGNIKDSGMSAEQFWGEWRKGKQFASWPAQLFPKEVCEFAEAYADLKARELRQGPSDREIALIERIQRDEAENAKLREERDAHRWIPVSEKLPNGEELPVLAWRGTTHRIEIGRPMPPFGKGTQDCWRPLPKPPESESKPGEETKWEK